MSRKKIIILSSLLFFLIIVTFLFLFINKHSNSEDQNVYYVVKFDTNGAEDIPEQQVIEGQKVVKPDDPYKDGYVFLGWDYLDEDYDFSSPITEDIILKAKWEVAINVEKYKVTFIVDNEIKEIEVTSENDIDLSNLGFEEKDGYVLKWYVNDKEYDFSSPITSDFTITGKYEKTSGFIIKFNSNGGTPVPEQTVDLNSFVKEPQNILKKGYVLNGWYLNDKKYDFTSPVKDSFTLKAKWDKVVEEKKKFTVVFDTQGGSSINKQIVEEGNKVVKPTTPTKSGYTFVEWQLNGKKYDFDEKVTRDITLKCIWSKNSINLIEAYFLNTQTKQHSTNESIILKTYDNKIILIDTANDRLEFIVDKLKQVSGSENPTIDYLIVSHSHNDHSGNLKAILNDDSITVKNIIYKKEHLYNNVYKIINGNAKPNTDIIETTALNENMVSYNISDKVKMHLLNNKDVYSKYSQEECNVLFYPIKFSSSNRGQNNVKVNNKYVYLNSLDPNDRTLKFSNTIDHIDNNQGLVNGIPQRRYYAFVAERTGLCNANSNSIVILMEVKTDKGSKYIYIPSDLENNGYSFFGLFNQTALNQGFMYGTIYSSGTTFIFKHTFTGDYANINDAWAINNNSFVDTKLSIRVAAESRVANQIRNYLGNNINDIVIYQETHHGFNNAKDAIDTLNLNRNGVYSIATSTDIGYNSADALTARSYHYVLNNTNILATSVNDGVYCKIVSNGQYECSN